MRNPIAFLLTTASLLASLSIAAPANDGQYRVVEPTLAPLAKEGEHIEDNYIVVLRQGVNLDLLQAHLAVVEAAHGLNPLYTFTAEGEQVETGGINQIYTPSSAGHGYYGYAGAFSPETLQMIRSQPEIAYVEHDQIITVQTDIPAVPPTSSPSSPAADSFFPPEKPASTSDMVYQRGAPWGLARISHRNPLTISTLQRYDYSLSGAESNVDIYIIDTGVNVNHVELEGRATWGKTIPKGASDYDGNGHGSHCAGIAASRKYGVAKGANIIAVKVLGDNGSGTLSDVIAGILWASDRAALKKIAAAKELAETGKTSYKGSVGSMSLGGGKSQATDDAVNAAVDSGLYMSVAAGNDNKDAADYSPARAKKAIAVGASTLGDERAYFSNHGSTVAIFGPGLNILSIWNGGNQTTNTISGTSMACPAISGLIAYYLNAYGSATLPYMTADEVNKLSVDIWEDTSSSTPSPLTVFEKAYGTAFSLLPKVAQAIMPASFAPVPKKNDTIVTSLTPAQMKGLLRKLSTKGILTDLPEGTPNMLAFNNATVLGAPKKTVV